MIATSPALAKTLVTALPGDGIGPEVFEATRRIFEAAEAPVEWEVAEAGAAVFRKGIASGAPRETLDSIARNRIALKGPLETPVGYGNKSANVTLRKHFELYANIRPVRELPGVKTPFTGRGIDMVIVRENVEDVYAGIEHMQTPDVAQCLKLMTRPGCERIIRAAFGLAQAEDRRKLTCATKANIMKLTEGMMKRVFEEVGPDYPDIAQDHIIIDNCAHQLVIAPEQFDVIVTSNMNGDIISDLAAGLVGGLGIAPSSNLGDHAAIFEAVHGSAPAIAGKGLANPTALLSAAIMMLRHIGAFETAETIEQALFITLAEGENLTGDLSPRGHGVGTDKFVGQVIENLGRTSNLPSRAYRPLELKAWPDRTAHTEPASRELLGVDIFLESSLSAAELGASLTAIAEGSALRLDSISNRGVQVWPATGGRTFLVDHFDCRFMLNEPAAGNGPQGISDLVKAIGQKHSWMHVEKLQRFDGKDAFERPQGES
ncbi:MULTISPECIES: NADP-dependent isocitrate dehydrogenase [Acidiphilium]|uniref:Isocitrate dehydrogenase [NADP] n=1 Tax=Acidiphilium multivorum (strain DSM 11245 / JCM 8867 / NBRC 100883 / AIU 301) TaxID=926570 RepID=F0J0T5_ACIMA|nr:MULTISPECIES: NADP-dependent isocitrate dehydrogenase [Acidiphilium]MBS3023796.1 NADP-dependent isocitrate dehydrogenase [Acidiphilium multivorum]BAJ81621.1 isocitrate dehydrogenase [Acidiphilium multivorum AIU301]GAN74132.1 isocitrate dehydrogenase [Acidiphilium multivorum AIU301]